MSSRDTELQRHGEDPELQRGSPAPPIFRASLFTFPDCAALERAFRGEGDRDIYSRVSNPTVRVLEEKIALLEQGDGAIACASGMGAVSAVLFSFLGEGDHLICLSRAYGPTLELVNGLLRRLGVEVTLVDPEAVGRLESLVRDRTRLIYVESPASFTFEVIDLRHVARVGAAKGIPTATDNSWASPLYQQPLASGISLSVHSGTKYIAGHSDILLGVVAGKEPWLGKVRSTAVLLGASLSPEDAFLAVRGLRTLSLRMKRHEESAFLLARRLLADERVAEVLHPALPFFRTHALWIEQFSGASGLFSFRLRGDPRRFCDALRVFRLGVSWGGFESLALPHAVVEAAGAAKSRSDIARETIRLSVGLEDPEDLWEDLERGLAAAGGA
jgi:cystathionine beta-lyase